jgi:hypothetical protein
MIPITTRSDIVFKNSEIQNTSLVQNSVVVEFGPSFKFLHGPLFRAILFPTGYVEPTSILLSEEMLLAGIYGRWMESAGRQCSIPL